MCSHVRTRLVLLSAGSLVILQIISSLAFAAAPTGTFVGVLNEQRNFGDSMNTVTFFNSTNMSLPLFSVYMSAANPSAATSGKNRAHWLSIRRPATFTYFALTAAQQQPSARMIRRAMFKAITIY
jgi:hypothetical protein